MARGRQGPMLRAGMGGVLALLVLTLVQVLAPVCAGAREQHPPSEPLCVDLSGAGLEPGRPGGEIRMLIASSRDTRLASVYGYARLVGYRADFTLGPDILKAVDVEGGRRFTLHLRPGHRWSDGHPFTSEDFRYFWEDVAQNPELSPAGPPAALALGEDLPVVEILDALRVRYTWPRPNPYFLPLLAKARDLFLYRPAHYLSAFHARYAEPRALAQKVAAARVASWAALHNRMDNMYDLDNPALPTLQPFLPTTEPPAQRFVFVRNPYFHRVDEAGVQLPYVDRLVMTVADERLIAAKTAAGESDLQARGLAFSDVPVLKAAEARAGFRTLLWRSGAGSEVALYPNLNANDPVWRALLRDGRVRRAMSLAIDREEINEALYLGLAVPGNNTLLPESPLSSPALRSLHAGYDLAQADALLDEAGLGRRARDGIRLLADGRRAEILVETAGERPEEVDALELIAATWARAGLKLLIKPSERSVLRNRIYAGETVMSAWKGLNNAVATADMAPVELAPVRQDFYAWPKWGQAHETRGRSGEPVDLPAGRALLAALADWEGAETPDARAEAWGRMLALHAEEQFTIGTVAGALQPVVVSARLRNIPEVAVYAWEPGADFGVYHPDQFWFAE